MTVKRKKKTGHLTFYKLKITDRQNSGDNSSIEKKRLTAPFHFRQVTVFTGILLVFYLISLIAFAKVYFNLVTALFIVQIIFQ